MRPEMAPARIPSGRAPARRQPRKARSLAAVRLLFVLAQVPLFLAMPRLSSLTKLHAEAVLGVALLLAVGPRSRTPVVCALAYIAGCEVFWRMQFGGVPWEFAKYASILVIVATLVKSARNWRPARPFAYLLLLLISVPLTVFSLVPAEARDALSFNLSGPLALAVGAAFYYSVRLSLEDLRWVLASVIGPALGIAAKAATGLLSGPVSFGSTSNFAASGGFGPNQVAAILGLGALCCFFEVILSRGSKLEQAVFIAIALACLSQAALTFSRAGLYMPVAGALAASFFLVRDPKSRWKVIGGGAVVAVLVAVVVLPRLDRFTEGKLQSRFQQMDTSGRDDLVKADLLTWRQNPVLGAGPGMGGPNRARFFGRPQPAHTEYTRLLAEHGLPGLGALAVLILMATGAVRRASGSIGKALSAALLIWAFLYLSVDATRLVAPCFTFGLGLATIVLGARNAPGRTAARNRRFSGGRIGMAAQG